MIKIFVGSSTAAKKQAKDFIEGCANPNVQFLPWWEQFTPGRTLLEELTRIKTEVNAAVLIMTPEGVATNSKGSEIVMPNLNVLFEFGFFYGTIGKDKTIIAKYGHVDLPSDLSGYIHVKGSKFFKENAGVPVGKSTKTEFDRWLSSLTSNI